jgi:anti-sigma B factor antagonist
LPMALRIDQRDIGAVKVLDLAGKLAGDAADALWDRIDDLLDAGHSKLILNLGGVSFIDSAALGGLLSKRAAVTNAGGQLKLLNLSERVWDLIVTTKLEMVFDTFDSEANAVQSFR